MPVAESSRLWQNLHIEGLDGQRIMMTRIHVHRHTCVGGAIPVAYVGHDVSEAVKSVCFCMGAPLHVLVHAEHIIDGRQQLVHPLYIHNAWVQFRVDE
jgi:hypothetical protein